ARRGGVQGEPVRPAGPARVRTAEGGAGAQAGRGKAPAQLTPRLPGATGSRHHGGPGPRRHWGPGPTSLRTWPPTSLVTRPPNRTEAAPPMRGGAAVMAGDVTCGRDGSGPG